jgi:hypothetical protein
MNHCPSGSLPRYDERRGHRVSTYASPWIHQYMRRATVGAHNLARGAKPLIHTFEVRTPRDFGPQEAGTTLTGSNGIRRKEAIETPPRRPPPVNP